MARNQKLTNVVAGRTLQVATGEPGKLFIQFDDQSTMRIKTAGIANIPSGVRSKQSTRMALSSISSLRMIRMCFSSLPTPAHLWRFVTRITGWNTSADQISVSPMRTFADSVRRPINTESGRSKWCQNSHQSHPKADFCPLRKSRLRIPCSVIDPFTEATH